MEINVLAFGQIVDITARSAWKMQEVKNTSELRKQLEEQHPALKGMKYNIAVNKTITTGETSLPDQAEVALLPPFSGG